MLHVLWSIILGFIAGFIATRLMGSHPPFLITTIVGIIGSVIGGLIARLFSKPADGAPFHPAGLLLSIIGAVIAVFIWGKLQ